MATSASPLHHHPAPNVPHFLAWLHEKGVTRHDGIELKYANDGSGWGVHASKSISRGSVLCAIPRDLVLSAKTSSLKPSTIEEDYAGLVLQLTACLLHELRLGRESEWYPWLQVLPRDTVDIPTLWAHEELGGEDGRRGLDWLMGTEASRELEKKDDAGLALQDLKAHHASSLNLPPTQSHSDSPSFTSFLYAYSLVSSRGFVIDAYHTVGLIPFCDMFNHSSTLPHTSLSVDAAVCEICGSLLPCSHDCTSTPNRLAHLPDEYLEQLQKDGLADKVDMRAQRDIKGGEQVLSCYDEDKRNASLLVEYGFIDDDANTTVTWGYREILTPTTLPLFVQLIQTLESEAEYDSDQDEQTRELYDMIGAVRADQPEPLQIRPDGSISPNLFIALYLRHISLDEPDTVRTNVLKAINEIRAAKRGSSRFSPSISATIETIIELFRSRLEGQRHSDVSLTEVETVLNSLPPGARLERLGMQAMISERRLLERCLTKWMTLCHDEIHVG